MHPDLSPHLHTEECNKLISELKKCHKEHNFRKFLGHCNSLDTELVKCLRVERRNNQAANRAKAQEKQRKVQELLQADKTKAQH